MKNDYKGKKGKKNNTETVVLYYPMIYYAITIQPILTYTNDANRIQHILTYTTKMENNYPMHVPWSRGVRCRRRSHMGALPLSEK